MAEALRLDDTTDTAQSQADTDHDYFEMGIINVSAESTLDETTIYNLKNKLKNRIPNDERTTKNYMTKFERAKIIGVRAQQIALGAMPNIDLPPGHHKTPREIARMELEQKESPIIIHRIFHTGRYEEWRVKELI